MAPIDGNEIDHHVRRFKTIRKLYNAAHARMQSMEIISKLNIGANTGNTRPAFSEEELEAQAITTAAYYDQMEQHCADGGWLYEKNAKGKWQVATQNGKAMWK